MKSKSIRKKSSRHSKIVGDFGEAIVLYWLSKYGYECARIDHTGIDLIAREPNGTRIMGISVKSRDPLEHRKNAQINLPADQFVKVRRACEAFGCVPYFAFVVETSDAIRGFLVPLEHLEAIAGGASGGMRYWRMRETDLGTYVHDDRIRSFTLTITSCSWRSLSSLHAVE